MTKKKIGGIPHTVPIKRPSGGVALGESTNPTNKRNKVNIDTTGSTGPKITNKKK